LRIVKERKTSNLSVYATFDEIKNKDFDLRISAYQEHKVEKKEGFTLENENG
jgi:hypothetical protein